MKTIWKFNLRPATQQTIELPQLSVIRHVGSQGDEIFIWVEIDLIGGDPMKRMQVERCFHIYGTGHPIPDMANLEFIGTVLVTAGLVFHVYEDKDW